jgi:RNA polymerase sigma factor (sigma-70 family)
MSPVPPSPIPTPPVRAACTAGPTPVAAMSSAALVLAARAHDRTAWTELFRRYEGLVRSVAAGFRMQEADAADAVQNTWLRAVERLADLHDPEKLGGWLRTTARRECVEVLRRQRRERPTDAGLDELVASGPDPECAAIDAEARTVLDGAVARLPERRRQLIGSLFHRPEAGYAELSREIDIPVGSIGPTRQRALCTLRTDLVRVGYLDPSTDVPEGELADCVPA